MPARRRPARLKPGSTVALVAPAFHFDAELFRKGRARLESRFGVRTVALDSVHERSSYFAGDDGRRALELVRWLSSPNIDAVIAIRGGYGCARIYPDVLRALRARKNALQPKIVAGYSDLTILLNGLHQDLGWVTFHSPVVVGRPMREPDPLEERTFERALFTGEPLGLVRDARTFTLAPGMARGRLVGGCLSLIVSSIGTPYEVRTDDRVLFIEDVDEKPYRIDRMLTHLIHAGKLDRVRAIVFGQMVECDDPSGQSTPIDAIRSALEPFARDRGIPIVCDFPAGHGKPQATFPIGCAVEVRAPRRGRPEIEFLEAGAR